MNLRLPVLATVVTAAAAVAAFRALRHEPPPASAGFTASSGSATDAASNANAAGISARDTVSSGPGAGSSGERRSQSASALAAGAPAAGVLGAGYGGQRRLSNRLAGAAPAGVTVYVAGDVARAGVYTLPAFARSVDALEAAGGAVRGADLVAVNLAEPLRDGEEIIVPKAGAAPPPDTGTAVGGETDANAKPRARHHRKKRRKRHTKRPAARGAADAASDAAADAGPSPSDADAAATVVDLNSADENELETLPGIGASLAERIVAFREANGPYASPDDLLDVGGMTQSRLDAIEPYVTTR
jgi:competence protein ComEA